MPQIDTASKFSRFVLSAEDEAAALNLNPYFLMYLQNKVAAYAEAVVEVKVSYHPDPKQQMEAILEMERLRNFCSAYEELLSEITQAQLPQQPNQPSES